MHINKFIHRFNPVDMLTDNKMPCYRRENRAMPL